MWTELRKELEQIRKDHGFSNGQFMAVGIEEWLEIENKIIESFCDFKDNSKPTWLWEYFKLETCSISTKPSPYVFLNRLIDKTENVWFIVNETVNESDKYWLYKGKIEPIQTIIGESMLIDELYLVSQKFKWIICINHHNTLIASGTGMPGKLRELSVNGIS